MKCHYLHSPPHVFEYYTTFTLGIWSMLLNSHDLFFHLILLSITISWCNASVNPSTLAICLCSCNNTALHAEFSVLSSTVHLFSHCETVHIVSVLHCFSALSVKLLFTWIGSVAPHTRKTTNELNGWMLVMTEETESSQFIQYCAFPFINFYFHFVL